ncbi:MAG: phosphate/phosphite/phosphonate ABC transporter substrate-binding protein [bacterium]
MLIFSDYNHERETIDLADIISEHEGDGPARAHDPNVLFFTFTICLNPQEDVSTYMFFLDYLEKRTGYKLWPRFSTGEEKIIDELAQGVVQFAALECGTYILSQKKYGFIPLVNGLNRQGEAECRSAIITAKNSSIQKVEDLKGSRFAFGNVSSTSGHLIPRVILYEHGVVLKDLATYAYTGSHYNCANAVASGRFDAGCISQTYADKLAEEGIIKIIFVSQSYPSFYVVANKEIPDQLLTRVKDAILDFQPEDRAVKSCSWEGMQIANGFTKVQERDLAELEKWAREFHFMERIQ